ncbi:MAG: ureidoglycolate lyase [Planctomycetota bacterium]|jgi:DNA/RNA-binding domain of Phe-tRNA-synthetase-like protein/ureidoglycolate hydrolase
MSRAASTGDIALTARPATAENFEPFGQLLGIGDRSRIARRRQVLLALDEVRPGPRRFAHLNRYPEARRVLLPLGETPLLLVVLAPGDPASGPPTAFRIPPGHAVVLGEGVWHAGPVALEEGLLCELLETRGAADRMDRRSLRDLAGVEALRVSLPEEPGAPRSDLDLSAPGAVVLDEALRGRVSLGCLLFDGLAVLERDDRVVRESERVAQGLRAVWGGRTDLRDVPGVSAARELWREMGLDPAETPPRGEALLASVLQGRAPEPRDGLAETADQCALRTQVPLYAYEAGDLGDRLLMRPGRPGERMIVSPGRRVSVSSVPVLCDRDGPFAGPLGATSRAQTTVRTRRALVVLLLPAGAEAGSAHSLLDEISRRILQHCGGREAGRLIAT